MRRAGLGIIAAMAFAAAMGGSVALAGNTDVTIKSHDDDGFLNGKVRSSRSGCEGGRTVKLYWDAPGAPKEFENVAEDSSAASGRWRINSPGPDVPPGRYYAKVTRDGDCDKARSDTIRVPV